MDYDEPSFERSKVANFSVTYRNILFSDYAIALSALEADWTCPDYLVAEVMSQICGTIEITEEGEGDSVGRFWGRYRRWLRSP